MPTPFYGIQPPNTIKFLIDNPCNVPFVVYAETFLPALGKATLTMLSFGMDDVIRGAFRPKKGRGGFHRRKGKKRSKFRLRFPELGNLIGATVMTDGTFVTRDVSQGTRHLWVVDTALQRILFFWLIFDVISEGVYQWSSLILQSEFCQAALAEKLFAQGDGGALLGILDWQALLCPLIVYKTGGISWSTATGSVPAGKFLITAAVKWRNTGSVSNLVRVGIFDPPGFTKPFAISDPVVGSERFESENVISAIIDGPQDFSVNWINNQGATEGLWAGVFAMQIGL